LSDESLRRRLSVRFGGIWITDSEDFLLLFKPGRYPTSLQTPYNLPSTPADTTPTERSEMARLLSVNVEVPRDIEWKGCRVHIGVWKEPVSGRCPVRRLTVSK
jgi:hypothetical protein